MPQSTAKKKATPAATLADVGREAGVSSMAAAAVLKGMRTSSRIAPDTRLRILEAAAKLDYRPAAAGHALARPRTNTLGLMAVVDREELNQYFLEIFNGVLAASLHHGQNTTVFTLRDWERDARRIGSFCDGRVDGVVMVAPLIDEEALSALPPAMPIVTIHANHALPGVVNLDSDEEAGSCALISRLIELGHRRILHLAGPSGLRGPERRVAGYRRALAQAGLPFDPGLVREAGFSAPEGREATRLWLLSTPPNERATAIFCANDCAAYGCLEALAAAGLRVPEDVSVAGFDDMLLARACVPQLSSVSQPLRRMGERAVEILLELARGAPARYSPEIFPAEPKLRASVAGLPKQPPS